MQNVGTLDRIIRIVLGIGLLSLVLFDTPIMWGWLGLAPLMTGIAGVCPLYSLLGISTKGWRA